MHHYRVAEIVKLVELDFKQLNESLLIRRIIVECLEG
jgi:hypothetical protein